jgi:hypothetical protein
LVGAGNHTSSESSKWAKDYIQLIVKRPLFARSESARTSWVLLACAFLVSLGLSEGQTATYYVDFEAGNDANSGLSVSSAWKRCPGDSAASGVVATTTLRAGDSVLFKGGVTYRGAIQVSVSGAIDNPVTFKGNAWGAEKAQLEGAQPWSPSWVQSPSQAFAQGNANFAKIYYATAPSGFTDFQRGFYEDGDFLWFSQSPDLPDAFYYDNIYDCYSVPQGSSSIQQTRTSLKDSTRLTQSDSAFWGGAQVATWIQGNLIAIKPVTSFDPATDTLQHADLGANPYTDRSSYYSLLNHVSLISRPGEYAFNPAENRIYLWPRNSDNPSAHSYAVQTIDTAFTITGSYVAIEGFRFRHYAQAVYASSTLAKGLIVRNNDIAKFRSANKYAIFVNAENSLVEGNQVVDCQRAVGILSSATGIVIRNNFVSRTSRQGIWFMGAQRSQIVGNTITDIQGIHANALSVYSGGADILIANNAISLANIPITYEDSANLTFYGNVIDCGDRSRPISEWFGTSGKIAFINNTFVRNPDPTCIFVLTPGSAQYVVINNIIDGGGPASTTHDYNLFLGTPNWTLAAHEEIQTSLSSIFVGGENWRLKAGSAAIDRGTNPSAHLPTGVFPNFNFNLDRDGNPRGSGGAWDRGAYEFASGSNDTTPPAVTLTSPVNGAAITGSYELKADASDDSAVAGVSFMVDGVVVGAEDTTAPYSVLWNSASATNGAHTIAARARDAAGNQTTSTVVSVTVSNQPGTGELQVGSRVRVAADPSLRVRSTPELAGVVVGNQNRDALGTIVSGPVTANGYTWWQINYDSAPDGWSIQGDSSAPWLVRVTGTAPRPPTGLRIVPD